MPPQKVTIVLATFSKLINRSAMTDEIAYGNFAPEFITELASYLAGKRVLEVFSGNGLLASKLVEKGIDITATTLFAAHDGHDYGMHHPVIEMEARKAVQTLGADMDVLLMSWPTATEGATVAALAWGSDRPIVFIGEITDYSLGNGGLGGCASDLFFDITTRSGSFSSYSPRNHLEHAVVLHLDEAKVLAWKTARDEEMEQRVPR